jgi:uncharacterized protein (DUF433 family)
VGRRSAWKRLPVPDILKLTAGKEQDMTTATLPTEPLMIPFQLDEYGTYRVGNTRIPLERVIECYGRGDSAADIVDSFPDLRLADVFAMLSYYLNHEEEVKEYCRRQEEAGTEVMARIEAAQGPVPGAEKVRAAKHGRRPDATPAGRPKLQ